ncbi:MAG: hypothetical protein HY685_05525 [Chloroflexi bacterium]|nr:hypothetical protein [Chloroflexota bacterium]
MPLRRGLPLQPIPVALSASHRRAPLAIRERLAPRSEEEAPAWLDRHLSQGVLLATCNRLEVYTVAPSVQEGRASLQSALLSRWEGDPVELLPCLDVYVGEEAMQHLFEVSAGLDSVVVGEAQILGQVGDALRIARRAGTASQELTQLFTSAIRAGRNSSRRWRRSSNLLGGPLWTVLELSAT